MNDINHTPGPWFAKANDSYWEVNPLNGGEDGIPFSVANVCCSEPEFRDGGLQEANARLIAAAPELLAAAKSALQLLQERHLDGGLVGADLLNAIAKATGK